MLLLFNDCFIRSRVIHFGDDNKKGTVVQHFLTALTHRASSFVNRPNHKNKTALQTAYENGYLDAAQILFPTTQGVYICSLFFLTSTCLLVISFLVIFIFSVGSTSTIFFPEYKSLPLERVEIKSGICTRRTFQEFLFER